MGKPLEYFKKVSDLGVKTQRLDSKSVHKVFILCSKKQIATIQYKAIKKRNDSHCGALVFPTANMSCSKCHFIVYYNAFMQTQKHENG